MMRVVKDHIRSETFLRDKLLESHLDSFCVYSIVLQLNFIGDLGLKDQLRSTWLSVTGDVSISEKPQYAMQMSDDRSSTISSLYGLIGQKITAVTIEHSGALILSFDHKVITIAKNNDCLEEIWSVTPDSPDPYAQHDWSVTLTDESEIIMTVPEE